MGTELQRRGSDTTLPLWSARALDADPDLVVAIHRDYIDAGADIITANSFRTNRRAVERAGLTSADAQRLTAESVRLARQSFSSSAGPLIAGSDAPVEDCYSPDLVPSEIELRQEHAEHCRWLIDAAVDLLLLETMNTLREAVAAAEAAAALGATYIVSIVTDPSGERLLSGESLADALDALVPPSGTNPPWAIMANCSSPMALLKGVTALSQLRSERGGLWRVGGYPNSGEPDPVVGWEFVHEVPLEQFVGAVEGMLDAGADIVGSCCGTTPEHTRALRAMIDRRKHTEGAR